MSASHKRRRLQMGAAGVSSALYSLYSLDVVESDACRQRFRDAAKKQRFIETLPINTLKHQSRRMPPLPVTCATQKHDRDRCCGQRP